MFRKNVASQVVGAQMVSASDGSAFTGSVVCYVTGDGGTQALGSVGSGVCAHEGNGYHTYVPAQAETNYETVAYTFVGTGAIPVTKELYPDTLKADIATVDGNVDAILDDTGTSGVVVNAASGAAAVWNADRSTYQAADSFGEHVQTNLASATQASTIDTVVDAIKVKTDYLPSATAGAAGGVFIAGVNAATTVDITGNLSGSVGSVTGAVGSVTGNVGGNVAGSVGSVTGAVTVGTNNDKTGYSLTQTFPANFASLGINASGHVSRVTLTDTATTLTGHTAQTGDSFARLGAPAGASIAADIAGIEAGSGLDAAGVRAAVGLASANLDTQLADLPTVAEFNARTIPAANYLQIGGSVTVTAQGLTLTNSVTLNFA